MAETGSVGVICFLDYNCFLSVSVLEITECAM